MDEDEKSAPRKKAPYEKPMLHNVTLRPEEAVLGACKSATSGGPIMGNCSVPVACSSIGS